MTKLMRLFTEYGQSPWLDNLTRPYLRDGTLARYIGDGVRGVTANPTIFGRAIEGSSAYDEQFSALIAAGSSVPDAYWELVIDDLNGALGLLLPVYDESEGCDGFASIEVAPEIAHDTAASVTAARALHERIAKPNLLVKIPATAAGVPGHPGHDLRGPQHQHHPDLLPGAVRRGHRGVPGRSGGSAGRWR